MQPGGSVGAGAEHPRPLKEGCSTAARRAHAPHEAPSLALEGLPPCWKRGKISGSYASIVRWHSVGRTLPSGEIEGREMCDFRGFLCGF